MREFGDELIHYKYDPLPEEPPRHRKKVKKQSARSDHKHEYEEVCIDTHSSVVKHGGEFPAYHLGIRCKICGRLKNVKLWRFEGHMPSDMPLYMVDDFFELVKMKVLPEELGVDGD